MVKNNKYVIPMTQLCLLLAELLIRLIWAWNRLEFRLIKVIEKFIANDDDSTSVKNIFAIGDVANGRL